MKYIFLLLLTLFLCLDLSAQALDALPTIDQPQEFDKIHTYTRGFSAAFRLDTLRKYFSADIVEGLAVDPYTAIPDSLRGRYFTSTSDSLYYVDYFGAFVNLTPGTGGGGGGGTWDGLTGIPDSIVYSAELTAEVFSTIKAPSVEPNKFMYYDTLTNQDFERRPTSDSLVPMFTYENYFYNLGGVVDFQRSINELLANDSRVSVDVFGDSRTQNRREMVEYLVQAMGRKYGYAGYGFISTSAPGSAGSSNSGLSTIGRAGDWTGIDATNYPVNQKKRLTIDKYGKYSTTVGDSLMVSTDDIIDYPESYADSIAVIYTQRPGGGTFRFRYGEKRGARYIEAGNEVINTDGPLSIVTRMVFVGDQVLPFWSVRTLTTNTTGVEYLGFRHTDPSGIVYNNYSRSGSSSYQHWLDINPIAWPYFLGQDKPSLVISNWGTNEGDPERHRIYQDSVYQIAQAQSPNVDFLNISVPQRASLPNISGQQNFEFNINYENLILAKKYDAAVFNFSGLVNDRVRNTDFADDGTHEEFAVRRILAETIAQGIAPIAVENTPTYKEEKVSLYFREEVNALLNNTRSIRIGVPIHYDIVSDTEIQLTVDVMSTFVGYAGNYKWGISALVSPTGSLIRTNERLLYANVDDQAYFRTGDTIAIEISAAFVQDDYLYFDIYNPATTTVPVYIAGEVVVSNAKSSDLTYLVQDRITKKYLTGQSYSSTSTTPQLFPAIPEDNSLSYADGSLSISGGNSTDRIFKAYNSGTAGNTSFDWNTITTPGIYKDFIRPGTLNQPFGAHFLAQNIVSNTGHIVQLAYPMLESQNAQTWIRRYDSDNTLWNAWKPLGEWELVGTILKTATDVSIAGKLGVGSTATPSADLEILSQAISGREAIIAAKVSDAGNAQFGIGNATSSSGQFIPTFFAYNNTTRFPFFFRSLTNAANSGASEAMFNMQAGVTNLDADPNNGGFSRVTRNLLTIQNASTVEVSVSANGDITANSFVGDGSGLTGLPSDADADPTNELQTVSKVGSIVTLSDGGGTFSVIDPDGSPTNELQTISKTGTTVTLSDGGGSFEANNIVSKVLNADVSNNSTSTYTTILSFDVQSGRVYSGSVKLWFSPVAGESMQLRINPTSGTISGDLVDARDATATAVTNNSPITITDYASTGVSSTTLDFTFTATATTTANIQFRKAATGAGFSHIVEKGTKVIVDYIAE